MKYKTSFIHYPFWTIYNRLVINIQKNNTMDKKYLYFIDIIYKMIGKELQTNVSER